MNAHISPDVLADAQVCNARMRGETPRVSLKPVTPRIDAYTLTLWAAPARDFTVADLACIRRRDVGTVGAVARAMVRAGLLAVVGRSHESGRPFIYRVTPAGRAWLAEHAPSTAPEARA